MMRYRDWERYEDSYEKPKRTKKKKTWKELKQERKNKKPNGIKKRSKKMKYYLVDKLDNINTSVDLGDDIGVSGARTYFIGTKRINEKEFDKLWKVMSKDQYDTQFKATLQNRQNGTLKYEWWVEDKEITEDEDNILG